MSATSTQGAMTSRDPITPPPISFLPSLPFSPHFLPTPTLTPPFVIIFPSSPYALASTSHLGSFIQPPTAYTFLGLSLPKGCKIIGKVLCSLVTQAGSI